jgi:hypothetical protein
MKPTMHVAIALPVVKSSACLTAITIAIRLQIIAAMAIIPPITGMKPRIARTLGESEKPIQRSSWLYVASVFGPLNSLVPMK